MTNQKLAITELDLRTPHNEVITHKQYKHIRQQKRLKCFRTEQNSQRKYSQTPTQHQEEKTNTLILFSTKPLEYSVLNVMSVCKVSGPLVKARDKKVGLFRNTL
jgi:hypothetical protein